MMIQEDYMALAQEKYQQLAALSQKAPFYDHEKEFETIWIDLGQQVLEKTISNPPKDRRKKNSNYPLRPYPHCPLAPVQ